VNTRQNPRRHVVFIEIQPNAYNKYLSQTARVTLILFGLGFFLYILTLPVLVEIYIYKN
jgi:hypothetical protein